MRIVVPVVLALMPLAASAAEASAPKTPAPLAALLRMAGDWKANGSFKQGDQTAPMSGRIRCDAISGDAGLHCVFTAKMPDGSAYEERDLFGWNAGDRMLHWYAVTNAGEVHDHVGFMDGNRLVFQYMGPDPEGKIMTERIVIDLEKPRAPRVHNVTWQGDQEVAGLDLVCTR